MKDLRREDVNTLAKLSIYLVQYGVKNIDECLVEILNDYYAKSKYDKDVRKLKRFDCGLELIPDLQFSILRWELKQHTASERKNTAKLELKRIDDKMIETADSYYNGSCNVEHSHIDSDNDLCAALLLLSRALPKEFHEVCDNIIHNFRKTERNYC